MPLPARGLGPADTRGQLQPFLMGYRIEGSAATILPTLQGPVTPAGGQRLGRVIDMSWAPLPHPIGGGSAIAVATDDGAIALIDVAQTSDQSSRRQRCGRTVTVRIHIRAQRRVRVSIKSILSVAVSAGK